MKKVLLGFAVMAFILVIGFLCLTAYTGHQEAEYKDTAVPYIKEAIPKLSQWDANVAKLYFAPFILAAGDDSDLQRLLDWLAKLGKLKAMQAPRFEQVYTGTSEHYEGSKTIVSYTVDAFYEHGEAKITIRLIDLGGSFQVYHFNVLSNTLVR